MPPLAAAVARLGRLAVRLGRPARLAAAVAAAAGRLDAAADPHRLPRPLRGRAVVVGAAARLQSRRAELGLARRPPIASCAALTPAKLAGVETPVLLIGTERDRLVSPAAIRRAASRLPEGRAADVRRCRATRYCAKRDAVRLEALAADRRLPRPPRRRDELRRRHRHRRRGHGRREPRRRGRRRGLGAAARGRGPARLSLHRPLGRFLGGKLWRALHPAADHRLGPLPRASTASFDPRGALHLADAEGSRALAGAARRSSAARSRFERLDGDRPASAGARPAPGLGRRACSSRAAPTSTSPALHAFYLAAARRAGREAGDRRRGRARCGATVGGWTVETAAGAFTARDRRRRRRRLGRSGRRAGRAPRRSASSPIAGRWPSCASIRRRRPICRWSSTRSAASTSSPRPAGGCG